MPADMKAIIADTLNEILKTKKLDKITVKDLVDTCKISRQTFYYHFKDLMDVVEWNQQRALKKSIENSLKASTWREAIEDMVREAFQNRELIQRLLSSERREEMEYMFFKAVRTYLQEILREKAPNLTISPADADTVLCFYSFGIVGMILADINRKNPDVDVLAEQMCRLLTGEIFFHLTETNPQYLKK